MKKSLSISIISLIALASCAPPAPTSNTVTLSAATGGEVASPDEAFAVILDSDDLIGDTTITVTQHDKSASVDGDVTLSNIYEVTTDDELQIAFNAELRFTIDEGVDTSALGVAHGEVVGEAWSEVLEGSLGSGEYLVNTTEFSYFMLIDQNAVNECACDVSEGCDADCECDEICEVESGECSASCMAQSGAQCCTTCGGCNEVEADLRCEPTCAEGFQWDCEVQCCFDYENTVCAE